MAKQGMSRPDRTHTAPKNDTVPVPEIQGKAKHTKQKANPIIEDSPTYKTFHTEKPISNVYPAINTDLGRDNVENDLPAADLQDL